MCIRDRFRDESWFKDEVFETLREFNVALCVAEGESLASPFISTADFGYLRLRLEDYTPSQIKERASFVRAKGEHWRDAFIYFKHEETCVGPKFANQMIKLLER